MKDIVILYDWIDTDDCGHTFIRDNWVLHITPTMDLKFEFKFGYCNPIVNYNDIEFTIYLKGTDYMRCGENVVHNILKQADRQIEKLERLYK